MPTTRPQKAMNLDLIDHKRAQALAKDITKENRTLARNPRIPETPIREVVSVAIQEMAERRGIHIDE